MLFSKSNFQTAKNFSQGEIEKTHRAAALLRRLKELLRFQVRNPLLQNRLAAWLHFGEDNSHPVFRPGVNHLAVGGEGSAAAHNPQQDLRPFQEWDSREHIASKQTQIAGECGEKLFGAHIADFSAGYERIAGSAMEFKMNREATSLLEILRQVDCSYKVNHASSLPPLPNLLKTSLPSRGSSRESFLSKNIGGSDGWANCRSDPLTRKA